ncbi:MAG TPA: glutamate-5-semialdehyde dehydrogenase [Clostridiaceae bacterium]|nr:glutamate-5-semialdehyde dehydrogenase [Clostridiaceae bacterium]
MIKQLCHRALIAETEMRTLSTKVKNRVLREVAKALIAEQDDILESNQLDLAAGEKNGLSAALLDRLALNPSRIKGMADSLETIASFPDPIGEVVEGFRTESGLSIQKVRAPLGIVAIIYESRPNVTIDAAALCLKSSNVTILRGSSAALNSNRILADLFARVGESNGMPKNAVQLLDDPGRDSLNKLIVQNKYIDVLIPRGGKQLKESMMANSTIPMIFTGDGTCHIYLDETAEDDKILPIILNAKTQRPGTCNSVECVLIQKDKNYLTEEIVEALLEADVKVNITQELYNLLPHELKTKSYLSGEELFGVEFLSKEILLHQVESVDVAIAFINQHGTQHSDCILTQNVTNAEKFLNEVDSAVVYLNASTRFSDGGEFGFGGEIGISTQKLHARGPMGIKQLTSEKFLVRGQGQIRE